MAGVPTPITVTRTYTDPDDSPSSGSVTFELTHPIMDLEGATVVTKAPTRVLLDDAGSISVVLPATNDPTSSPGGNTYKVTEQIRGVPKRTYLVELPYDAAGGTVALNELVPVVDGVIEYRIIDAGGYDAVVSALALPDLTGNTDTAALQAAVDQVYAQGGGDILWKSGLFHLNARVDVPQSVNVWGGGFGADHAATILKCVTADAGISFGEDETVGGRGGRSGNFLVDGGLVATNPIYLGLTVLRLFEGLECIRAADTGWLLEGTQNCTFVNCPTSYAASIGIAIDYSAAGNRWYNCGIDSSGEWAVEVRQSGAAPPGLHSIPFDNQFYGGIWERVMTEGCLHQTAGDLTGLHDLQLVNASDQATFDHVWVEEGSVIVDGCYLSSGMGGQGTGFHVDAGGIIFQSGVTNMVGLDVAVNNAGDILQTGHIREISVGTSVVGTAPVTYPIQEELERFAHTSLGSIPLFAAGFSTPQVAMSAVGASWWYLDPDSWPTPEPGRTLQYRLVVTFQGATVGDVLKALLYDTTAAAALFAAPDATQAAGVETCQVVSAWQPFPTTAKGGYTMVQNVNAARGTTVSGFIEVRIA